MDEAELKTLEEFNVILNILAGGCGLAVVILLAVLKMIQPRAMDRVSIRFTLGISLVDFVKAAVIAVYALAHGDDSKCVALAFGTQWLTLVYLSLNVMIALNLKRVFVDGRAVDPKWERQYWFCSVVVPTLILSVPLVLGKLGYDSTTQSCEYRTPGDGDSYLWLWLCWLIWMVLACIYCAVVVCLTINSLMSKASVLDRVQSTQRRQIPLKKDIRRLIMRVSLYCIIPVLTQIWFVIFKVHWHYTQSLNKTIVYLSVVGSGIILYSF